MKEKRKHKKKHRGRIIFGLIVIALAAGLLIGKDAIVQKIKMKAAQMVAEKLLEEQFSKVLEENGISGVDVSKIVDNIEPEDMEKAIDIAEKYVEPEKISEYVELAKDGNISEVKQRVKQELSGTDEQELRELYEKYKNQIPLEQLPLEQLPVN